METISTFVFSVGLIIFAAHFFTALFERTRVPDVLPLIFIGILIGPLFGILAPDDFSYVGPLLSSVALVLMLFEGGSHLTLETLKTSLKDCVVLSLTTFFITVLICTGTAYYFMGNDLIPSFFWSRVRQYFPGSSYSYRAHAQTFRKYQVHPGGRICYY